MLMVYYMIFICRSSDSLLPYHYDLFKHVSTRFAQQPWDAPRRSAEKHVLLSTPGVDCWDQQEIPGSGENLNVDPSFPKLSSYSDKTM